MSKGLKELVDNCSDLLIEALENSCSNKLFIEVLKSLDQIHNDIDRGLLK
jgi:hypothetical protein